MNKKYTVIIAITVSLLFSFAHGAFCDPVERARFDEGVQAFTKGDYETAASKFNEAIAINPENADTHYNLGLVYNQMDLTHKAIESYKKAIKLNPKDARAYYNLGNTYYRANLHKNAIAAYKTAIQIDPYNAMAYYNLANAYTYLGDYKKGIANFKKTIELKPDYAFAYYCLGDVYYASKRYELAEKNLKKAKSLFTMQGNQRQADEVEDYLARVYLKTGSESVKTKGGKRKDG